MRGAGRVVAQILAAVQDQAKAGMRTAELDEVARDVLARAGAYSPFLDYQPGFAPVPFPAVICTSVNDAALHGIPGRYKLATATCSAWTAAPCSTAGRPTPRSRSPSGRRGRPTRLIDVTRDALRAGIAAAVPGARIGDISAAIGAVGRAGGYGICTDFGGHGVGRAMHEDPYIPNEGAPGAAAGSSPGWSSRSSRGSWPAAGTSTGSTGTAGRSAAATAAGPRTPSTRWPSPRTARRS